MAVAADTFDADATDGTASVVTDYTWMRGTTRTAQKFRADLPGENGHLDEDYEPPLGKASSSPGPLASPVGARLRSHTAMTQEAIDRVQLAPTIGAGFFPKPPASPQAPPTTIHPLGAALVFPPFGHCDAPPNLLGFTSARFFEPQPFVIPATTAY